MSKNIFLIRRVHDSLQTGNGIINLSNNNGHSEVPKIATIGNKVYVTWIDDSSGSRDIYFRKSINNGLSFGPVIDVSKQNGGSVDPQIAVSGDNVYLAW